MATSEIGGKACVFGLLSIKEKKTYDVFFNKIKEHIVEQNCPKTIISDFEQAVFNICAKLFPTMEDFTTTLQFGRTWEIIISSIQELIYLMYTLCYVPLEVR